jgi:hypothetical protein
MRFYFSTLTTRKRHKDCAQSAWLREKAMTDIQLLMAILLVGFVIGYGTRDLMSRQRRKRWRQRYWSSSARIVQNKSSSVRS